MATVKARPDEALTLRISRRFKAPRERVFRALTNAEQLAKWWGPKGFTVPELALDVRPGGAWRTTMRAPDGKDHVVSGVYREIVPPSRLVFTWGWETEGPRGHETVVTIELSEVADGTRLELYQEVFESADSRDRHEHGWASCLDSLEEALAAGTLT
jgi:uncharacterized protein YndB with AHSA1/START domain